MPKFDVAFFSFNRHQDNLVPGLQSVIQHVPDFNEIILVWDDFVREQPIDFDLVQEQIDHPIRVIKHTELYDWPDSLGRWGWIKQQLAKMLCYTYSQSEFTWICDGDLRINADPELWHNDLPVMRTSGKLIVPETGYYHFMKKYFGLDQVHPQVLINGGGNCLMNNRIVEEIWTTCQQRNAKSLIECVQHEVENSDDLFPFSEYETYGNYCLTHHSGQFHLTNHNWAPANSVAGKSRAITLL
jgi:hypothetical protein